MGASAFTPAAEPTLWEAPPLAAPACAPRAVADFEEIERAAREEGFSRGHADGYAQGQAEVKRLVAQLEGLLDAFTRPLAELDAEVEQALARLATELAGVLVRGAYAAEPARLAALVREAVAAAGSGERAVEVRLHPEDLALLETQLADVSRLVGDAALARGDVRVHAENVRIDARLATRLEMLYAELHREVA